jgi:hypothetical protein
VEVDVSAKMKPDIVVTSKEKRPDEPVTAVITKDTMPKIDEVVEDTVVFDKDKPEEIEKVSIEIEKKPETEIDFKTKLKKKPKDQIVTTVVATKEKTQFIEEICLDTEVEKPKRETFEDSLVLEKDVSEKKPGVVSLDIEMKSQTELDFKPEIKKKPKDETVSVAITKKHKKKSLQELHVDTEVDETSEKREENFEHSITLKRKKEDKMEDVEVKITSKPEQDIDIQTKSKKRIKESITVFKDKEEKQISDVALFEDEVIENVPEAPEPEKGLANVSFVTHKPLFVSSVTAEGKEHLTSFASPDIKTAVSTLDEYKAVIISTAESETREESFIDKREKPRKAAVELLTKN